MSPTVQSAVTSVDTVWGMIAVVQMIWLPGYVLTKAIRIQGWLTRLCVGFAASLWINLMLILLLSLTGMVSKSAVMTFMILELCVLGLLCWRDARKPRTRTQITMFGDSIESESDSGKLTTLAVLTMLVCAFIGIQAIGQTFFMWDAVASWNRWAMEWAVEGQAIRARDYPQLLPATWSISYILIGHTEIQQFAKSIQGLFPLLMLCSLFIAAVARKSAILMRAIPITMILIWVLYKPFFVSGYMDIPVAALMTLSWCLVLRGAGINDRSQAIRTVLWGAFAGGVAAVSKQAGLILIVSLPLLILTTRFANPDIRRWKLALVALGVLLAVLLPWYSYSSYLIWSGQDSFIGKELMGNFHPRPSIGGRFITAFERLVPPLTIGREIDGSYIVWAFLLSSVLGIFHRVTRPVVLCVAIPSWVVWALGFSYSTRNMAYAVPAMAVGISGTIALIYQLTNAIRMKLDERNHEESETSQQADLKESRAFVPVVLVFVALVGVSVFGWIGLDGQKLAQSQIEQRSQLGVPAINQMLFDADGDNQRLGMVGSSYAILRFIPGFEKRAVFMPPTQFQAFEGHWYDPNITGFIVRDIGHVADDKRIIEEYKRLVELGKLIELGEHANWHVAIKGFDAETETPSPLRYSEMNPPKPLFEE